MIRIPSFELSNLNAFNFREYEWKTENIINTIKNILSTSEKYNITVKNISIEEKPDKGNYSEITVDKIIPRLKQNYGYTDENLHTQILGTVKLKVPEEGNIEMATNSSKEVRVVTSDDNTKNYVKRIESIFGYYCLVYWDRLFNRPS